MSKMKNSQEGLSQLADVTNDNFGEMKTIEREFMAGGNDFSDRHKFDRQMPATQQAVYLDEIASIF